MAKKLTKNQRDLIALGVVLLLIIGVLLKFFVRPSAEQVETYQPQTLDTVIPDELFKKAEFRRLRQPVELPVRPGAMGRENPFAPYGTTTP